MASLCRSWVALARTSRPHARLWSRTLASNPPAAPPAPNPLVLPQKNLIQRIYSQFSSKIPQTRLRATGTLLSLSVTQDVDLMSFLREFDMPDSYYSWYLVAELHLYMLSIRLMAQDTNEGLAVRNALMESFWDDCAARVKAMDVQNSSERKASVKNLFEEFQATLFVYDYGLVGDDKALASALWKRFFQSTENPNIENISKLVNYVRRTMSVLDHMELGDLVLADKIEWLPLVPNAQEKTNTRVRTSSSSR